MHIQGKCSRSLVGVGSLVLLILGTLPANGERISFVTMANSWKPATTELKVVAPCHAPVTAVLNVSRNSGSDPALDVPILVEFRQPGVTLSSPATYTRELVAKESDRGASFTVPGSDSGCGTPWQVTVRPKYPPTKAQDSWIVDVTGNISLIIGQSKALAVEDATSLPKGHSLTKNLGGPEGLDQGWVQITGTWVHSVLGLPGPLPVKLNFELINPNGTMVKYDTGYSEREFNPCCSSDKVKLRFFLPQHVTGQWKLRIRNDTSDDVMTLVPKATMFFACQ